VKADSEPNTSTFAAATLVTTAVMPCSRRSRSGRTDSRAQEKKKRLEGTFLTLVIEARVGIELAYTAKLESNASLPLKTGWQTRDFPPVFVGFWRNKKPPCGG
jgi:hypothetical protein